MGKLYPLRILLAEDNVINQKVIERILQKMSYRPDIVSNGLEVLQSLRQIPYDVIFMDVHMPDMDGIEATRKICQKYKKEDRPYLIALTADVLQGDKEKCIAEGMDDFTGKPVKIPELERALERAYSHQVAEKQYS